MKQSNLQSVVKNFSSELTMRGKSNKIYPFGKIFANKILDTLKTKLLQATKKRKIVEIRKCIYIYKKISRFIAKEFSASAIKGGLNKTDIFIAMSS